MVIKGDRRRAIAMVLLMIIVLAMAGSGGYLYYLKHKEPTQGIFVYDWVIRGEEVVSGHLYQSP